MYVVAGVSGNTGKVVADKLLAQKLPVRVVVRSEAKGAEWRKKGADVAVADLSDAGALARALEGARGAYLLVPPNFATPDFRAYQRGVIGALVEAVTRAKPKHVVLLSSIGAHLPSGTGPIAALHEAEKKLSAIDGVALTALRAGYFVENVGASLSALGQGILPTFIPANAPVDMIATPDIGAVAASLLAEGSSTSDVVQLGGPPVTFTQIAAALSRITGKEIKPVEAPLDAVVPTFTQAGMTEDLAKLYQEMLAGFVGGTIGWEAGRRRAQGKVPLEEVLRKLVG